MADQFRADCLSAAGNPAIRTPNLDRLAREGVLFRCAYSSMPTCTPARSALLTGLAPWNHGMLRMIRMADRYSLEKPRALREAGYYTMGLGKMHYHPQRNAHGYHQVLLDESGRAESPNIAAATAPGFGPKRPASPRRHRHRMERLHRRPVRAARAAPPHRVDRPDRGPVSRELPARRAVLLQGVFRAPAQPLRSSGAILPCLRGCPHSPGVRRGWAANYAPRSWEKNDIWHGDLGGRQVRHSRQGYYGSVSFVDEQVGRILEALEKRGWLEETLIVFTSDQGDMTGDHHLWCKSYAYESSARIPMRDDPPPGEKPFLFILSVDPACRNGSNLRFVHGGTATSPPLFFAAHQPRRTAFHFGVTDYSPNPAKKSTEPDCSTRLSARRMLTTEQEVCEIPANHRHPLRRPRCAAGG